MKKSSDDSIVGYAEKLTSIMSLVFWDAHTKCTILNLNSVHCFPCN
jgi:hypothetical protein